MSLMLFLVRNMENKTSLLDEIKRLVIDIDKEFYARYSTYWRSSDGKEHAAKLMVWIDSLFTGEYSESIINRAKKEIVGLAMFADKPPRIGHFTLMCKVFAYIESQPKEHSDLCLAFSEIYRKLGRKYKSLWDKDGFDIASENLIFWLDEIIASGLSRDDIEAGYQRIRKVPEYRTYPPNIDQFIDACMIASSGRDIPIPEEAYHLATKVNSGQHFLIKAAKKLYGGYELRTEVSGRGRDKFEKIYRTVMMDYINNPDDQKWLEFSSSDKSGNECLKKDNQDYDAQAAINALDLISLKIKNR